MKYLLITEDGDLYTTNVLTTGMRDGVDNHTLIVVILEGTEYRKIMDFRGPQASPRLKTVDKVEDGIFDFEDSSVDLDDDEDDEDDDKTM